MLVVYEIILMLKLLKNKTKNKKIVPDRHCLQADVDQRDVISQSALLLVPEELQIWQIIIENQ